ncbi:hypothetical protein L5515_008681 [Caenorhabditis briggsae]|uniref:Uncharacterized protein n=1 Tax=Caenorhabditis briggsae TaxID=6238 RepID=A0AAE9F1N2_CAEBR|nr:hypothetical protein L5515_008681 [Caenorhabditis briggsae]
MIEIPPEEQYETDTIFSQEGDTPESYLETKLLDFESDNEVFSDSESNLKNERFLTVDLPSPTTKVDSDSFRRLVENSKFAWSNIASASSDFDRLVFQDDEYDIAQDSFRYGRVTAGTSYNLITGKMQQEVMEKVKEKDEDNDDEVKIVETVTEDEDTHIVTTEVTIPLNGSGDGEEKSSVFDEMYESQMPKFFKYRDHFPEIQGIWTLLFDQNHYGDMSTFELQASICAALNSKHHLIICIGVDDYNTVTGVEMSATDRVVFRMALSRAVAGEFQPPLIKLPPKQLTGVSPMKRDVSEMMSNIDVKFIPVFGKQDPVAASGDAAPPSRFLVVVRVKELTEKLYQLSSGRIYVEEDGRVVELANINEAFRNLIINKTPEQAPILGSVFMLEPEPFVEDAPIDIEECSSEEEEEVVEVETTTTQETPKIVEAVVQDIVIPEEENNTQIVAMISDVAESVIARLDSPRVQNFGWFLFATAIAYGVYQAVRPRF